MPIQLAGKIHKYFKGFSQRNIFLLQVAENSAFRKLIRSFPVAYLDPQNLEWWLSKKQDGKHCSKNTGAKILAMKTQLNFCNSITRCLTPTGRIDHE